MNTRVERRRVLLTAASGLLAACAAPMPALVDDAQAAIDPDASALLQAAQAAHGLNALERLREVKVRYEGAWSTLATKLQPVLTDPRYRGGSEETLFLRDGVVVQRHRGPGGTKYVRRDFAARAVVVRYDDQPASTDPEVRAAAALVADGYRVFLLGPMAFTQPARMRIRRAEPATFDGRECDGLVIGTRPGLGMADEDRFLLHIDRDTRLMRRVRITLNGLKSTRGAIADIDVFDYMERAGVRWPTRFVESLARPIYGLPVHEWRLAALDLA